MLNINDKKLEIYEISEDGLKKKEGKYAKVRLNFLNDYRQDLLNDLQKDNMLENHLIYIELQSEIRLNEIIEYKKQKEIPFSNIDIDKYVEYIEEISLKQVEEELLFI